MFASRGSFALVVVMTAAGVAHAQDEDPRARARAALSLSKAREPAVAVAPMPRQASVYGTYADVRAAAISKNLPAVLYVGCDGSHECVRLPNAVTARVAAITGYPKGTVLVCFPHGDRLWVHKTLECPAPPDEVKRAVDGADLKKNPAPPRSDRKLDWS